MNQRNRVNEKGHLQIGQFDKDEVERMEKNIRKKIKENPLSENSRDNPVTVDFNERQNLARDHSLENIDDDLGDICTNEDDSDTDEDFTYKDIATKKKGTQNRVKLNNSAKECVRWGVSARGGAAIINAALAAMELLPEIICLKQLIKVN